jgi:hypothetical protein
MRCWFRTLFCVLLTSASAWANGRLPAANQIVLRNERVLLRTTFGVLSSADNGNTWDWVCERGLGFSGVQDPPFAMTDGSVFVAAAEGLLVSNDALCNTARSPSLNRYLVDLTLDPLDPKAVYVLSSEFEQTLDSGALTFRSSIARTDGTSVELIGAPLPPELLFETIEVHGPSRIYLSGASVEPPTYSAILVSDDRGATFTRHPVPLISDRERAAFVSGVAPSNADRVYVRTGGLGGNPGRLLVSDDGAKSFRTVFTATGPLLGFALSPDGAKVFVGGPKDGVHVAAAATLVFEKQSEFSTTCLATKDSTLWACGNGQAGVLAASSTDDGKTFTTRATFNSIRGPLGTCAANASAAVCAQEWPALQRELGITRARDAGTDAPAAPAPTRYEASGGNCAQGLGPSALVGILLSMFMVKRRRK